jgi:hypothetical protein
MYNIGFRNIKPTWAQWIPGENGTNLVILMVQFACYRKFIITTATVFNHYVHKELQTFA